jgi:hypothetical protein
MPLILGTNSIKDTGFNVANSLRFNSGSSDSLQQSTTAGTQTTWTFSFWIKRSTISSTQHIAENDLANYFRIRITSGDVFEVFDSNGNNTWNWNPLLRDTSAWSNIVLRADSTDATNGNRLRLYVNGSLASANTVASISQNYSFSFNQGGTLYLGKRGGGEFFDGYIAEMVFIDGTSLDPTSFGEFDSDSNIWKPIDVSGLTFGNEGFYLDFENSGSLGADVSGNGNNFTVNNLTAVDQSTDTCTNNWCTMNPLDNYYAGATFAEGNLKLTSGSSQYSFNTSTFQMVSGKWYWEAKVNSSGAAGNYQWGIVSSPATTSSNALQNYSNSVGVNDGNYNIFANGSSTGITIGSFAQNDILMFAFDADNNGLYVGKNGTWLNSGDPTSGASKTGAFTPGTSGIGYFAAFGDQNGSAGYISEFNFGGTQTFTISSGNSDGNGYGNFEYSVPSGYYSLNTKNLSEFG